MNEWIEYPGSGQMLRIQHGMIHGWEFARIRGSDDIPYGADLDELALTLFGPDKVVMELRNFPVEIDADWHPYDAWLWVPLQQTIPLPPASLEPPPPPSMAAPEHWQSIGQNEQNESSFSVPSPVIGGESLAVHIGINLGWEYAAVSTQHRCPSWEEMAFIKSSLWPPESCVVEFHPPQSQYVNVHPYCLWLFRPVGGGMPRPPVEIVGTADADPTFVSAFRKWAEVT